MRRQQRTNAARGKLPYRTTAAAHVLDWTLTSIVGNNVSITLTSPPAGISVTGIPQVTRSDTNEVPIGVTVIGGLIELAYSTAVPAGLTLNYPGKDPAIRGSVGEFVAAGAVSSGNPPTVPSVQQYGASQSLLPNTVWIPNADANGGSAAPGTSTSDWLIVAVPQGYFAPCPVYSVAGGQPVSPGVNQAWAWDGANWQPV